MWTWTSAMQIVAESTAVSPVYSAASPSASCQDSSTHAFTLRSYSRRFSLNSCAAIEFAGEFGLGSLS